MILELTAENIAILEKAHIALGAGFTALTGETGAGKSLLIDAIDLALGGRADSDLVRSGCSKGTVTLTADLTHNRAAHALCEELGVELEDGMLFIQREVHVEGRSVCRIAGKHVPVGTLKRIGDLLVDLHGQHDHQALLDPLKHLEYLDAWMGDEAFGIIATVGEKHRELSEIQTKLNALRRGQRERTQRLDLLRFQVEEIESAGLRVGEAAELGGQIKRLQNVERLLSASQLAMESVDGEDRGALSALGSAIKELEPLSAVDENLGEPLEQLRSAFYAAQEARSELRAYCDGLELDPAQLESLIERQDLLKKLFRKYGEDEEAVLQHLHESRSELDLLEGSEETEEELAALHADVRADFVKLCTQLSVLRRDRSRIFAELVQNQLRDLAMEKALFEVRFAEKEPDATGMDAVDFLFSANAGEPVKPLSKIASGGELARVMLSLKVALAGRAGVPTLIFDEVDTGLSGRAAAVVARKLTELGSHYQVIVISHLPQIAGAAHCHFQIQKVEAAGRMVTQVASLESDERVREIARMLAGEEIGESALANARELLGISLH